MQSLSIKLISPLIIAIGLLGCGSSESPKVKTVSVEDQLLNDPVIARSLGIDPEKEDTDGDGLLDKYELKHAARYYQPNKVDTDGDGVSDAYEDDDADGLTALQEQALNTSANLADTDRDGINDGEEVNNYKTDPLKSDSDNDGLDDGFEIANKLNPLDASDADTAVFQNVGKIEDDTGNSFSIEVSKKGKFQKNEVKVRKLLEALAEESSPAIRQSPLYAIDVFKDKGVEEINVKIAFNFENKDILDPNDLLIFVKQNNYYVPIDTIGGQRINVDQNSHTVNLEAQFTYRDSKSVATSYWFVVMEKSKYSVSTQRKAETRGLSFDALESVGILYSSYLPPGANGSDDTDNDGLTNEEEEQVYNTDPTNPDTDGDGVEDAVEVEFSMDPNLINTDGDSFDDGFEFNNIAEGYDPIVFNEEIEAWDYFTQTSAGAVFGDFACEDSYDNASIPCVVGSIGAGFVVWGDIVSIAYDGINGNWGWLVVDVASVIPIVGDAAAVGGKVSKFVVKNGLTSDVSKTLIKKVALKSDPDLFVNAMKHVDEVSVNKLLANGMNNVGIHRLAKGGTTMKELASLIEGAADVRKVSGSSSFIKLGNHSGYDVGFVDGFFTGKHGWKLAEDVINEGSQATRGTSLIAASGRRFPDMQNTVGLAKESKTGRQTGSKKILEQIQKDVELLNSGQLSRVEWHFFPSGRSNTIGMTEGLKTALEDAHIPYIIHLP